MSRQPRSIVLRAGLSGLSLATAVALAACTPAPPDPDRPPEPQAATGLRDATQAPLEKTRAVEEDVRRAADAQRAAIEAAGG